MDNTGKVVYRGVFRLFLGFVFVALIFCSGGSVCADDGKANIKVDLGGRYFSDGLLIYNELKHESGKDFLRARKKHVDLLDLYLHEMKGRQLEYAADLLTEEAASILKELRSIRDYLGNDVPKDKKDLNSWAESEINKASERFGKFLIAKDFEQYQKKPFDIDGFEKLGKECRDDLTGALKEVTVRLNAYIKDIATRKPDDLLIKRAVELCEANRKAIILLYMFRFARFEDPDVNAETSGEGLDVRLLRQLSGDINRTIFWNSFLQKRIKNGKAGILEKYSASEYRRVRLLKAILGRDMREAQFLLLKTLIESSPAKTTSP